MAGYEINAIKHPLSSVMIFATDSSEEMSIEIKESAGNMEQTITQSGAELTLPKSLLVHERSEIAPAEAVCLVDDDPSVLRSVGRLLESDGLSVSAFSEPESFLEYVAANSVPLVVLDIWMEKMTGMELLAHLCARSPQTRVIFITGHEDPAAEATVTQAGAFAFFIKPFDSEQFLNAVHCALGHSLLPKKGAVA